MEGIKNQITVKKREGMLKESEGIDDNLKRN
jgi:hypothetical protein